MGMFQAGVAFLAWIHVWKAAHTSWAPSQCGVACHDATKPRAGEYVTGAAYGATARDRGLASPQAGNGPPPPGETAIDLLDCPGNAS